MKDKSSIDSLDEEYPILRQKDLHKSIKHLSELPDYLRKINENILNIDKRISKKEFNTDKVKEIEHKAGLKERDNKSHKNLLEIKDIIKQSVESLNDIFKNKKPTNDIKTIEELNSSTNNRNINQPKNKLQKIKKDNVNSLQKPKTSTKSNIVQISSSKKENGSDTNKKKVTNNSSKSNKDNHYNSSFNKERDKNKSNKLNAQSKDKSNKLTQNTNDNYKKHHQSEMNTIDEIHIKSNQHKSIPTNASSSSSNQQSNTIKAYCQGYNKKIDRSNNSTTNNNKARGSQNLTSISIKTEQIHFQFNPKNYKENVTSISQASDASKRLVSENTNKIKKTKNQFKKKIKTEKPHPQRLFTERNDVLTKHNTITSKIERSNSGKNYYKMTLPKKLSIENVLRMLLLLNDYLITSDRINDYNINPTLFEELSFIISTQLKELTEHPYDKDVVMNNSRNDDDNSAIGDDENNVIQNKRVIKLQRKWRRYKVDQLEKNNTTVLRSAIINELIDNEGTEAEKMIKTINSTVEAFINSKNTIPTINQLSNVTSNRISEDERYTLYKNLINKHLKQKTHRNNPSSSLVHNLNDELSYNAILSGYSLSQSNQK